MNCHYKELTGNPSSILLEIHDKDGVTPASTPAVIQYVFDETVVLKIDLKPAHWQETMGRNCQLSITREAENEPLIFKGFVSWASFTDEGKQNLYLVWMRLTEQDLTKFRVLKDLIPPDARDIRKLWNQWDEAQGISTGWTNNKIYMVLFAMAIGGFVFLLLGQKYIKL